MVYYEALILGKDIITTVPVSDELIQISDYAAVTDKTPEALAGALAAYQRGERPPFNMETANRRRREALRALAEGE